MDNQLLTPEWWRDTVKDFALLLAAGVFIWRLQDRWIRQRMRAEKDYELVRAAFRQLSAVRADVAEMRGLFHRGDPAALLRAYQLAIVVTEKAYALADEARPALDKTTEQGLLDGLTLALASIRADALPPDAKTLDSLNDYLSQLMKVLLAKLDFGT